MLVRLIMMRLSYYNANYSHYLWCYSVRVIVMYIIIIWLVVWDIFYLSIYIHIYYIYIHWECHHPNWRTYIFQRVRAQPPTSTVIIELSLNVASILPGIMVQVACCERSDLMNWSDCFRFCEADPYIYITPYQHKQRPNYGYIYIYP